MASITAAAPQFLVEKLSDALTFYEQRLGFSRDFVYGDFYASVSRGGAVIHLKCAPKLEAERVHRRSETISTRTSPSPGSGSCTTSSSVAGRRSRRPSSRDPGARATSTSRIPTATSCASWKPSRDDLSRLLPLRSHPIRGRSRPRSRPVVRLLDLSAAGSAHPSSGSRSAPAADAPGRPDALPVGHAHGRRLLLSNVRHPAVSATASPHVQGNGRGCTRVLRMEYQRPVSGRRRPRCRSGQARLRE